MMNDPEEYDVDEAASVLTMLFEDNSEDEEGALLVSSDGLQLMGDFFGTVPREERGIVFLSFLSNLYAEGHCYNVQQFLDMEPIADA
jgi:hypothetical protein